MGQTCFRAAGAARSSRESGATSFLLQTRTNAANRRASLSQTLADRVFNFPASPSGRVA